MALIVDRPVQGPATHAMVVAVGTYPYLRDGTDPQPDTLGLGQLTSPLHSARVIADFLLDEFAHPDAPLATLTLLTSPVLDYASPGGNGAGRSGSAVLANVVTEFKAWQARCETDEANVALFFFCGHGVAKGGQFLLLEDFGSPAAAERFTNTLDLEDTAWAMRSTCKAKVQCFFVDACQQVSWELLKEDIRGTRIGKIRYDRNLAEDAPIFHATLPTDPAYGRRDQPTFYTRAVLAGLRGLGSDRRLGRWEVKTGRLQEGINTAMLAMQREDGAPSQKATVGGLKSGTGLLHVLPAAPVVPVWVELDPASAGRDAELTLIHESGNPSQTCAGLAGPWRFEAPAGHYDGKATLNGSPRRTMPFRVHVHPPICEERWEVGQ